MEKNKKKRRERGEAKISSSLSLLVKGEGSSKKALPWILVMPIRGKEEEKTRERGKALIPVHGLVPKKGD